MRTRLILLVFTSLLGCRDATGSTEALTDQLPLPEQSLKSRPSARRVAAIDTALVVAPVLLRFGDVFERTVPVTSGGCRASDTTVVAVSRLTAVIVPNQRVSTSPDIVCTSNFFIDRRTVRLSYTQRGAVRVRLISRSGADQQLLAVERAVTVE